MPFDRTQPFEEVSPVSTLDRTKDFEDVNDEKRTPTIGISDELRKSGGFSPMPAYSIDPKDYPKGTAPEGPTPRFGPPPSGWTEVYSGLDGLKDRVNPIQRGVFDLLSQKTDNQDETVAQAINKAYVKAHIDSYPEAQFNSNWPAIRDAYAQTVYGVDHDGVTDKELYGEISKRLQQEKFDNLKNGDWKDVSKYELHNFSLMAGEFWNRINEPLHKLPSAPAMPNLPWMVEKNPALVAGVYNGFKPILEGFESPAGILTLGVGGELNSARKAGSVGARRILAGMSGIFTGLMAKGFVDQAEKVKPVFDDPKSSFQDRVTALAEPTGTAAMVLLGALGTIHEVAPEFAAKLPPKLQGSNPEGAAVILREEAKKTDSAPLVQALHNAADQMESIAPKEKSAEAATGGEKPVSEQKGNVQELDNGGFVVTDANGKLIDYADTAEQAQALAQGKPLKEESSVKPKAPAELLSEETEEGFPATYNLIEDIPGHPKGSTVSKQTLEKAGFEVPEPKPKSEKTIGLSNEAVNKELASMGEEPLSEADYKSQKSDIEDATQKLKEDRTAGTRLIQELTEKPRPLDSEESAVLLAEMNRLKQERAGAAVRESEAKLAGDKLTEETARAEGESLQKQFNDAAEATRQVGTLQGRSLAFRNALIDEDYSLASMQERRAKANEGKALTEKQTKEVKDLYDRLTEAEKKLEEYKASKQPIDPNKRKGKTLSQHADAARKRILERLKEGRSASGLDPLDLADHAIVGADYLAKGLTAFKDWSVEMVKEFGERIKPHLQAIYEKAANIGDSADAAVLEAKKARLEKQIEKLKEKIASGDLSVADKKSNRPSVQEIEKLEQQRDDLRGQLTDMRQHAAKVEELEAAIKEKESKLKTGDLSAKGQPVNRPAIESIEALKQQRDELNRELTEARKQAKAPTEEEKIKSKVDAINEKIAEKKAAIKSGDVTPKGQTQNRPQVEAIELAKRELEDLNSTIADMRKGEPKTPEQKRLQDLETQIARLENQIVTGEIFPKGKKPDVTSPEIKEAQKRLEQLQDQRDYLRDSLQPKPEPKTDVELESARLDKQISELERQIRTEEVFSKEKNHPIADPELDLKRAKIEALKEERLNIRQKIQPKPEPKTSQEKKLSAFKANKTRAIDELKRRVKEGDFEPKKGEETHLDEEANRLQSEQDLIKQEYKNLLEQDRYENSSLGNKVKEQALSLYDTARLLMTTGEFSFVLRQGKVSALSHPVLSAKALPDAFRALMSDPAEAHALNLKVLNHPDFPAAKEAKLHIMEHGQSLNKTEEFLIGKKLAEKIPVVGKAVTRFEQAATVFLNKVRFDTWRAMKEAGGGLNEAEQKQLAMFVNEATGRGGLGSLEAAAVPLGRIMFSPRYFASRLQLIAGHSLWGGTMATRRIIAKEYAKTLIGLGVYYSLLKLALSQGDKPAEIGTDPRSSDFGKVKVGNTRVDPLAGVAQVVVFAARTASGEKTNSKGRTVPIRGDNVPYGGQKWSDVAATFARSKLHPVPGAIINLFDGTDLGGNKADLGNQSANLVAPVTWIDVYQALEEQDLPEGVSVSLLALLGEGLQTYDASKTHKPVKTTPR